MFVNSGSQSSVFQIFFFCFTLITLVPYSVGLLENDDTTRIYCFKAYYYIYTNFRLTSRLWTYIVLSSTQTRARHCLLTKANLRQYIATLFITYFPVFSSGFGYLQRSTRCRILELRQYLLRSAAHPVAAVPFLQRATFPHIALFVPSLILPSQRFFEIIDAKYVGSALATPRVGISRCAI